MAAPKKKARKKAVSAPKKKVSAAKRLEKFSGSELKKAYMKEITDDIGEKIGKQAIAKKASEKKKIGKEIAKLRSNLRKLC